MKTAQIKFAKAINALKLEVPESIALSIFELHLQAQQEYARQCCEDLRERIAETAKTKYIRYDDPKHNYHGEDVVDKDSILNVPINLP